jgi:formate dehydrogenase iron-sulfur subunit
MRCAMGLTEPSPYLARQERLTFARMGVTDPLSLADYEAHGGWAGLRRACAWTLRPWWTRCCSRACAGAGARPFRPASNGKPCALRAAAQKVRGVQRRRGRLGHLSDRMTMEGDPFMLIEGMAIAALAVGATQGYIYIRSEYPHAMATMTRGHRAGARPPAGPTCWAVAAFRA